jgi:hypothetical protein
VLYSAQGGANRVAIDGVVILDADVVRLGVLGGAWSPDGRWLAVAVLNGVYLLDTLSGAAPIVLDLFPSVNGFVMFMSSGS